MIALNTIVFPFSVDVQNAFARELKAVHLADHTRIDVGLVSSDHAGLVQSGILAGLLKKGPCCLDIPARCETEINKLTTLINSAPKIAPLTANPDVRLVDMPVQTAPRPVLK